MISALSAVFIAVILLPSVSTGSSLDNWVAATSPSDHWFYGMTYGNNQFVTVGDYGTILTSPDGVAWTLRTSPDTHHLKAVAYGNGRFIAVGTVGTTVISTDNGETWGLGGIARHFGNAYDLYGITYGNSTFVAVGLSGTIFTSADGVNWTSQTSPTAKDLLGITYKNPTFVAVGESGTIINSSDGYCWSEVTPVTAYSLTGVTAGSFVAVGMHGTIISSPYGINWNTETSHVIEMLNDVAYGNGNFVAVGVYNGESGTILTSPDGANWSLIDSGTDYDLEAVAYDSNNQVFAAAGGYGIILLDGKTLPVDPVWIPDVHHMYRGNSIQDAYNNAFDGDTIESMALHFEEDLNFGSNISVTLGGGYGAEFRYPPLSATTINGSLTISQGTVTLENIIIR
jgi:photosystem II stability/assembly factor-like uncharacterized protein